MRPGPGPYMYGPATRRMRRVGHTTKSQTCEAFWPSVAKPALASSIAILNYMVQYEKGLDGAFAALADPTRRGILERLGEGEATITELAQPFGMSLTGVKKHVLVLEQAGLLSTEKQGRTRYCRLGPRRLEDVRQWIDAYRNALEERLDRFGEMLAQEDSRDAKGAQKRNRAGERDKGKQS